jgi:hypothetical protein
VTITEPPIQTVNNIADITMDCINNVKTLTATGGGSYSWGTKETTASITITIPPTTQTMLKLTNWVTVTDVNGCKTIDSIRVTYFPCSPAPPIVISAKVFLSWYSYNGQLFSDFI